MGANKLKVARVAKNMTQEDVARLLGITLATYNRKELGNVDFKRREVLSLSKVLNLSLKDVNNIFFNGELTERISDQTIA